MYSKYVYIVNGILLCQSYHAKQVHLEIGNGGTSTLKSSISSLPSQPQGVYSSNSQPLSYHAAFPPPQKSCYEVDCFGVVQLVLVYFMHVPFLFSPQMHS